MNHMRFPREPGEEPQRNAPQGIPAEKMGDVISFPRLLALIKARHPKAGRVTQSKSNFTPNWFGLSYPEAKGSVYVIQSIRWLTGPAGPQCCPLDEDSALPPLFGTIIDSKTIVTPPRKES